LLNDKSDRWLHEAARQVPRYTSYPTAHGFVPMESARYASWLAEVEGPIALYVHFPFCSKRCTYCACSMIATTHGDVGAAYLDLLDREAVAVSQRMKRDPVIRRLHWGGGTPTYYSSEQLERTMRTLLNRFTFADDADLSVEVDPRVTTDRQLDTLRRLGFTRISIGVQDFAPAVQASIGRLQTPKLTRHVLRKARSVGFESVNVDLVYGLPLQTERRMEATMETVVSMRPDRLAVYGYAHLPEAIPHQRKIDTRDVPDLNQRRRLEKIARTNLREAGYCEIGLDHFALPEDRLAIAATDRSLYRDFMGYTTRRTPTLIGLGVSSIGDLPQGFAQNVKKLSLYEGMLKQGQLPVDRGLVIDDDDRVRREVIQRLMCDLELRVGEIERHFDIRFDVYFEKEVAALREPGGLIDLGIVHESSTGYVVDRAARSLVRNVCRVFDSRTGRRAEKEPLMSNSG